MPKRVFLGYSAGLIIFAVAILWLHLSERVGEIAIVVVYFLYLPVLINALALGRVWRWFNGQRYKVGWLVVYGLAYVSLVAPRLHWPPVMSWIAAVLAVIIGVAISLNGKSTA